MSRCPFEPARHDAGAALTGRADGTGVVVYLRRGRAVLTGTAPNGTAHGCAVRGPGSLLGLEAVLGRPVPYEACALTDVAICVAGAGKFRQWLGPLDSPLGATLRLSLEETARRASERHVLEGTALRRVAAFLLEVYAGDKQDASEGVPHAVLASVLRMRPETLSRALTELRVVGALAPGRTIRVLDQTTLRRFAGV